MVLQHQQIGSRLSLIVVTRVDKPVPVQGLKRLGVHLPLCSSNARLHTAFTATSVLLLQGPTNGSGLLHCNELQPRLPFSTSSGNRLQTMQQHSTNMATRRGGGGIKAEGVCRLVLPGVHMHAPSPICGQAGWLPTRWVGAGEGGFRNIARGVCGGGGGELPAIGAGPVPACRRAKVPPCLHHTDCETEHRPAEPRSTRAWGELGLA